jgi:prolyl-tRNA editing enzyme YbaK/EbsC (Cys-tRNA(Pro) deacylase)
MSALMDYLRGRGVTFVVLPGDGEETTPEKTVPRGFSPHEFVKTIVLVKHEGSAPHALLVIPDAEEIDLDLARRAVGDPDARLASDQELELAFPDYDPGTLPPLALFFLAPMYVDPVVLENESVVFRAGSRSMAIAMSTKALFRDDPVVITALTHASAA